MKGQQALLMSKLCRVHQSRIDVDGPQGGVTTEMNTESRKGTTIASAARIPATITTNAAAVSSTDPALDLPEGPRCRKVPAGPRDPSGNERPGGGPSVSRPRRLAANVSTGAVGALA